MNDMEFGSWSMVQKTALIGYLNQFFLPSRLETLERVLAQRTRYLTVVLDDIYQSQNANAVLRTCECFGIQDVHIIENRNTYLYNPDVVRGAHKWLTLNRHSGELHNTRRVLTALRTQGYRLVATSPHNHDVELPRFDVTRGKFALIIGNEREGISGEALQMADEYLRVPMVGFTESLNLSVCTAVIVRELTQKMATCGVDAALSDGERVDLRLKWMLKSLKRSDLLVNEFLRPGTSARME